MPGPFTFRIEEALFVKSQQRAFDRMLSRVILTILVIYLAVGLATDILLDHVPIVGMVIGAGFAFAVLGLARFVILPRNARKQFHEYRALHEDMTFTCDDQSFEISGPSGKVEACWQDMVKWDETEQMLLIFPTQPLQYLLPKDQFPEQAINFVRSRLIESGMPTSGEVRN